MKALKNNNRNKSQNKKIYYSSKLLNKSVSLKNHNISNINKSKNKKSNSINKSIKPKSKQKYFKNNIPQNEFNNHYDNYELNYNQQNNIYDYNNNIPNKNYSSIQFSNYNNYQFNNNINSISKDNLSKSKSNQNQTINIGLMEYSNIFKKTLDRLLITSNNLLENQNNILKECDILAKNVAMNNYAIETLNKDDTNSNYPKALDNYTNNISTLFSKVKNYKSNSQINEQLKNENNILKNKLEMLNITQEDNLKMKDGEISTLKIVLVSEINHILNFLQEIGYDKIPINKMEVSDITSQKITNFFELIIKIIKQMKELIQKKETIISKMTIEQNTLRDNKDESNNNKSFERLTFDYNNNYNIGFKNYNFSIKNNNQKNKYNISLRNQNINNMKKELDIGKDNKSIDFNNNKNNNVLNKNDFMNESKREINNKMIYDINNLNKNNDKINYNDNYNVEINLNTERNTDSKMNSYINFYNRDINYSYDRGSNKSYQTGAFNQRVNDNYKEKNNEDEINDQNINKLL